MASAPPTSDTSWLVDLALAVVPADDPSTTCEAFVSAVLDTTSYEYASVWLYDAPTDDPPVAPSARLAYAHPAPLIQTTTVERSGSLIPLLAGNEWVAGVEGDAHLDLLLAQEDLSGGCAIVFPLGATGFLKLHAPSPASPLAGDDVAALRDVVDHFTQTLAHTLRHRHLVQQAQHHDQLQGQLRTTSIRLSSVITNMQAAVLVEDDQRHITRVNQPFCDLFGLETSPEALVGASSEQMADLVCNHFDEPMAFAARIEAILREGRAVIGERLSLADGRVIERDYVPIRLNDDHAGSLWQYRDVTERVQSERRLKQLTNYYEQIFTAMPVHLAVYDSDGRYQLVSPSAVDDPDRRRWLFGKTDDDYVDIAGLDAEIGKQRRSTIQQVVDTKQAVRYEETLRLPDGPERHLVRHVRPILDLDGTVVQVMAYGVDITDRKEAEHARAESEARYRQIVEQARDIIYHVAPKGHFMYANAVALRLLGTTEDALDDLHFLSFVRADYRETVAAHYERQVHENIPSTYLEFPAVTSDGREIWVGQNAQLLWKGHTFLGIQALARDITARRAAEIALRDSERQYRSVVDHIREVIFQTDVEGRWTFLNPAWTELTQYSTEESRGSSCLEFIHPDDRALAQQCLQSLVQHGEDSCRCELRFLTREDDVRWVKMYARSVVDDDGHTVGTTGSLNDITARRRASQTLQHRLQLENLITELSARFINAPSEAIDALIEESLAVIGNFVNADRSYVFHVHEGGLCIDNTHEWCAEGIKPQIDNLQNLPTDWLPWWMDRLRAFEDVHLSSLDELPPEADPLRKLLASQDIRSLVVVPMVKSSTLIGFLGFDAVREERSWSEDTVLLLRVVADVVASALQRKQAEDDLQQSEERWRRLVENHPEPLLIGDQDAIIYANPSAAEVFGVDTAEALVGRSPCEFIASAYCEAIMARTRAVSDGEAPEPLEHVVTRPNGEERIVASFALPVTYKGRSAVQTVMRDITDRHENEVELRKAKALAEQSSKAKEQFLANMSHEMRTPLSAVIGMTYLLNDTPLTPEQQRFLDGIHFSADTLLSLINDLLDFAKVESGHIDFESVPFELPELIHNLTDTMRYKAREKALTLHVSMDETVPPTLIGDPTRLNQILLNLLGNALKFTHEGEVALNIRLVAEDDDQVRIAFAVADTGIGIQEERLEDIFEKFTQARRDTTRHFGGTGLGLSIVKELTQRQGGTLDVHSEEGAGSIFTVTLPFQTAPVEAAQQSKPLPNTEADLTGMRILLVEDNEINQAVAERILSRWGAEVTVVSTGDAALQVLKTTTFDLVLMDIHLPGLDGYETTRRIREELDLSRSTLPVLALTASVRIHSGEDAERSGMNDFVLKPFVPRELRRCIARHLSRRCAGDGTTLPIAEPAAPEAAADTPPAASIDLTYLRQQTENDADFLRTMLDLTETQLREGRVTLARAHDTNNWAESRFTAHKLKSTANTVGATALASTLAQIEQSIDENKYHAASALLATVQEYLQETLDALREARASQEVA